MRTDVAQHTATATHDGNRKNRVRKNPIGTNNTMFMPNCRIAVTPSARISPMNCNGLSCAPRWCVAQ